MTAIIGKYRGACSCRDWLEVVTAWGMLYALPGKLSPDQWTLSSGRLGRLLGRYKQCTVLAHRTLGGSGGHSRSAPA